MASCMHRGGTGPVGDSWPRAQWYRCNVNGVGLVAVIVVGISFENWCIFWAESASCAGTDLAHKFASNLNIRRFVPAELRGVANKVVESTELLAFFEDFSTSHDIYCKSGDDADPVNCKNRIR